ncbi:MAG: right-handed parallel beta-helix repeat-containing protein [Planctomycetes bacterium]|nr:right-handed parallel beta-helix repeat-containing protein [Planctomycetota bacterium]
MSAGGIPAIVLGALLAAACASLAALDTSEIEKVARKAPPLGPPHGHIVNVNRVEQLYSAVNSSPGTTVLIADGHYYLPTFVRLQKNGITIRGASGDPSKVILDGSRCSEKELIWFEGGDDCMVADITLQNAPVHGFTIKGESDTQRTVIYNCRIRNVWERSIKGTAPKDNPEATRPAGGRIQYCVFIVDHRKTVNDYAGGDYIAGIDMMWLKDWVISDNVFVGIQGKNGVGRGAIFIWNNSEDVIAERNLIVDCDRGICFGNPSGGSLHMTRGIIRNNYIVAGGNTAIEVCRTKDTIVCNNTVYNAGKGYSVHFFQGAAGGRFINNLIQGRLVVDGGVENRNNVNAGLRNMVVNAIVGDLHLTAAAQTAIKKGIPLPEVTDDFDGHPRTGPPDIGADEFGSVARKAGEGEKGIGESTWELVARKLKAANEGPAPDALERHAAAIESARNLALAGDYAGAAAAVDKLIADEKDKDASAALGDIATGFRAVTAMKRWVIEGVGAGSRKTVWMDFMGAPVRAKLTAADDSGVGAKVLGEDIRVEWAKVSPARFHNMAKKYAATEDESIPEERSRLLGLYSVSMGIGSE